jgi:hypothetical protein
MKDLVLPAPRLAATAVDPDGKVGYEADGHPRFSTDALRSRIRSRSQPLKKNLKVDFIRIFLCESSDGGAGGIA